MYILVMVLTNPSEPANVRVLDHSIDDLNGLKQLAESTIGHISNNGEVVSKVVKVSDETSDYRYDINVFWASGLVGLFSIQFKL